MEVGGGPLLYFLLADLALEAREALGCSVFSAQVGPSSALVTATVVAGRAKSIMPDWFRRRHGHRLDDEFLDQGEQYRGQDVTLRPGHSQLAAGKAGWEIETPLEIRGSPSQTRASSHMNIALVAVLSMLSLWPVLFIVNRYGAATAPQRPLILWAAMGAVALPITLHWLMAYR